MKSRWYGVGMPGLVVYDSNLNKDPESKYVRLYLYETNNVHFLNKEIVKEGLIKETNINIITAIDKAYSDWLKFYSSRLENDSGASIIKYYENLYEHKRCRDLIKRLNPEAAEIMKVEFQNKKIREKSESAHKLRIKGLGLEYKGIKENSNKRHRTANCYSCNAYLENSIQLECNICYWMLCACGACGCGYTHHS